MERDWPGQLEQWLQEKFVELCAAVGQRPPISGLRINPGLAPLEAQYFLLGMEAGLFQTDDLGCVQSPLLPFSSTGNAGARACQIFWYNPPPPRLYRECVCQLSVASFLIIERGWLARHVVVNPVAESEDGSSYGIDLLIQSPEGRILVCVEIKRSVAELHKLITDLRNCCRRGLHAQNDCGFPQNHPKYEFCLRYEPVYFWAVSPEASVCLEMKYHEGSMTLEQLDSLPPRSVIESL